MLNLLKVDMLVSNLEQADDISIQLKLQLYLFKSLGELLAWL